MMDTSYHAVQKIAWDTPEPDIPVCSVCYDYATHGMFCVVRSFVAPLDEHQQPIEEHAAPYLTTYGDSLVYYCDYHVPGATILNPINLQGDNLAG